MSIFKGYPKLKVTETEEYEIATKHTKVSVVEELEEFGVKVGRIKMAIAEEESEGKDISMLEKKEEAGVVFTCQCCGFSRRFTDEEEAFKVGWDTPEYFSGPITCSCCPSSHLIIGIMPIGHANVHRRWRVEGHPELAEEATQNAGE